MPFVMAHKAKVIVALGFSILGMGVTALTPLISRAVIDDEAAVNPDRGFIYI